MTANPVLGSTFRGNPGPRSRQNPDERKVKLVDIFDGALLSQD